MTSRVPLLARTLAVATAVLAVILAVAGPATADWTTYHGNPALTGVDPTSGHPSRFAQAWASTKLAGSVYAEPLVYRGLVYVVTESDDVYAFHVATGRAAWHAQAGTPVRSGALPCGDISPTVGITSTPVIDRRTGRLYVVADVRAGASARHELIAYDARSGRVRFTRHVDPPSNPLTQLQREALALDRGRVLVGFGGNYGDCGQYKGFLLSVPADDHGPTTMYTVPTRREGAIWSGGGAPAVDAAGDVYVPTGNAADGPGQPYDHGDTLEKLTAFGRQLDYWAPTSWARDSASDSDLGSVSPALLGHGLVFQSGKNGIGYLIDTARLGHIGGERFSAPVCHSFGSDAYAAGILYVACVEGIHAIGIDVHHDRFSVRWSGPGSADGPPIIAGGRVWVTDTGDGILYGLDPRSGAVRVKQTVPAMEHFVTPAASDGRLFLATGDTLQAYRIASARR